MKNISARALHPALAKEGRRVVKLLPKMMPAKKNGKPVNVRFTLPINFVIDGYGDTKTFKNMNDNEVPIFPSCDSLAINHPKKCFEDKIIAHIAKNLNKKLVNNLKSDEKIVYASFTINEYGEIVDVNTTWGEPELRNEAIRIINLLPTMKPAKVDGKLVEVKYFLTIDFEQKTKEELKIKKDKK